MIYKFKIKFTFLLIFTILTLYSCNETEAVIPAYIYINNVSLETNNSTQGAPTQNITDIWVYVDGLSTGVFNKQQLIPIISDDYSTTEILLVPGIRDNGIKQDIQNYFLYKEIKLTNNLKPGEIDTISAVFQYVDHADFVFIEDFENGNIFNKDIDGDSYTSINISENNPRSGEKCGIIQLNTEHNHIETTTKFFYYNLPKSGNLVYLEMDYKGDNEFVVGISGKDITGNEYKSDFILLKPQESWNKIYLNLTKEIQDSGLESYRIFFKAQHNDTNETTTIFLDNIKLLYSQK